jgi:hypothetical protein
MALLASLTFAICQAHATNCPVPFPPPWLPSRSEI